MKTATRLADRLLAAFAPAAKAEAAPCTRCWYECISNWTVQCCKDDCNGTKTCTRKWKGC